LHLATSGRVIVRLSNIVTQDQILCDEKSTKVSKVTEVIGPVAKPYSSAISLTNNIKKFVGKKMITIEIPSAKIHKENRRKRKWKR